MSEEIAVTPTPVVLSPLNPADPPKVGDFWVTARLTQTPAGVAYLARGNDGDEAMLILLSEGAAGDAGARDRLAGLVNQMDIDTVLARGGQGQNDGRLGHLFRGEDDDPRAPAVASLAPWVALAFDGSPAAVDEARRILHEIDLTGLPQQGTPSGPDYRLHWLNRVAPGMARLWPLPWPGRHQRSGWITIAVSWLLMILIAAVALLLAVLVFQNSPPVPAPPPIPSTATSSASASPSQGSASPSPQSASPSPESASPSPESASPSPASESPSGRGSPTPNSKL